MPIAHYNLFTQTFPLSFPTVLKRCFSLSLSLSHSFKLPYCSDLRIPSFTEGIPHIENVQHCGTKYTLYDYTHLPPSTHSHQLHSNLSHCCTAIDFKIYRLFLFNDLRTNLIILLSSSMFLGKFTNSLLHHKQTQVKLSSNFNDCKSGKVRCAENFMVALNRKKQKHKNLATT